MGQHDNRTEQKKKKKNAIKYKASRWVFAIDKSLFIQDHAIPI